jgi:hypothetical protein
LKQRAKAIYSLEHHRVGFLAVDCFSFDTTFLTEQEDVGYLIQLCEECLASSFLQVDLIPPALVVAICPELEATMERESKRLLLEPEQESSYGLYGAWAREAFQSAIELLRRPRPEAVVYTGGELTSRIIGFYDLSIIEEKLARKARVTDQNSMTPVGSKV